jgi:cysteine desulfurase
LIYLDNAASTQIHEDVLNSMLPYLKEQYGNASSIHRYGRLAHKAIEKARKQIASLINADDGLIVDYLPVDKLGMVDTLELQNRISENTCLVSIMFGNNEVGTVQKISEITKICHDRKIPFHTDAVQAVGKIPIDVKELGIDLLSISSHKLHGPKGIGALYIKNGIKIDPVILGGGQEHGLRSGTENVANIVGFGKACEIAKNNLHENMSYVKKLRDLLVDNILSEIPEVTLNGDPQSRLPNNAHFTFLGVNGEDLIIKLDEYGIAASTGSACSVNTQKASHVLEAMGFSHEQITGSLRLTLGIFNQEKEIKETVDSLKKIVEELRSFSPFKEKYSFTSKS